MESNVNRFTVIVPAAGIGRRMGHHCPKQYLTIAGKTILEHTLTRLLSHHAIKQIILVLARDDNHFANHSLCHDPRIITVSGGEERPDSVLNGLLHVEDEWVLVHDAARPCLTHHDLDQLIHCALHHQGAILGSRVRDTMKRSDSAGNIVTTVERANLWHALTPQMFPTVPLKKALTESLAQGLTITDEASAMEHAGFTVQIVEGRADNIKVTQPEDMLLATLFLQQQASSDATTTMNIEEPR